MVATRRGAKEAPVASSASSSTLSAPPKRGGRTKTVVEQAAEPAPAPAKATKTTAAKRKAKAEPEDAEPPVAKKTVATKTTRTTKVQTKAEPAPAAPKRATRGRKAEEPDDIDELQADEEAPKPAVVRARKIAPVKKTAASKAAEPVATQDPVVQEPIVEEAPKAASRARKAPAKKAPVTKKTETPIVEEPTAVETTKPATRTRKPAVPKASASAPASKAAPVPVLAPRTTRGRDAPTISQESPLKAPARKPTKKTVTISTPKAETEASEDDALAELAGYPKTPAHIKVPISSRDALAEMPDYPETPAHIKAPISSEAALAEMPDYPKTPAHISAPMSTKDALSEMPGYPKTPAHIKAPISIKDAMAEMPDYPKTPAHILAPVIPPTEEREAETEAEIVWGVTDQEAFEELPAEYPATPSHITAPVTSQQAMAELPGYPKTPAHIVAPITPRRALAELPDYPTTPSLALEAALQEEITASVKKQTPSPIRYSSRKEKVSFGFDETSEIGDVSELTEASEFSEVDVVSAIKAPSFGDLKASMPLKPLQLAPTFAAPEPASPKKSALRSPMKVMDTKTPKKSVAWTDVQADESEIFMDDGILQGTVFYVDVTRNGKEQNFLFRGLLEDLGAKVVKDMSHASLTHVLFKDGSMSTLEKCLSSKGAIKCVNVGWVLDSESNKKRMDEDPYLVDLSVAKPASPLPTTTMKPFTPAKTPSKYALPPSSQCKMPSTPTSSEFDRSFNDDKENSEVGAFFDRSPLAPRTVPNKKSTFLFSKAAIKTPSRPLFLAATPSKSGFSAVKPAPHAFSTIKKRPVDSSLFNSSLGPPRKLRLF
ncbi:hypothetical protein COCCADRAFT_92013 [Bipolaris zeicola 26-R-13]|uniref:BRCT domain-containing protein n=1 Tax=Cochliobolus carbonum (strain 26-R-13) TaxID=930089 RepID=W6YH68_COCC2|nr:uncharacterized protein COCCADRAFT_92013 [Bipolaris zeicola 26-R-13]EUC34964.1 hypothetical protein COCCADRAFT_92013 [Bipolaris zeicola 26-R-13]